VRIRASGDVQQTFAEEMLDVAAMTGLTEYVVVGF